MTRRDIAYGEIEVGSSETFILLDQAGCPDKVITKSQAYDLKIDSIYVLDGKLIFEVWPDE